MSELVGSVSYVALGGLSEPQFSEESWKNNTIFPDCEAQEAGSHEIALQSKASSRMEGFLLSRSWFC